MTYVELTPDDYRQVHVRTDDGLWLDGVLEGYRQVEGVWAGYVRYAPTPGQDLRGWFEEPRIRGH